MAAISRLHVERRSSPERGCEVCLKGVYQTRMETDPHSEGGVLRRFGIEASGEDVMWHVEGCNHCGHVLMFRRDWRKPQAEAAEEEYEEYEDDEEDGEA
jgi:hypothetical protein